MNDLKGDDVAKVLESLGELRGELRVVHKSIDEAMRVIRDDLRAYKSDSNERISRLEDNVNKRFDSMGTRFEALEQEDKRLIEKVARIGVLGGGASGALVAGAVELLKRL